jgi:hypothetical protein
MSADAKVQSEPIRMVFELSREDHPRLYDDLIRFPKGTKRINRLRVLAHDGLIAQYAQTAPTGQNSQVIARSGPAGDETDLSVTNDLFAPSHSD